jgi:hypothetical protein
VSSESKPAVALRHLSSLAASYLSLGTTGLQGKVKPEGRSGEPRGKKDIDRAVEKAAGASAALHLAEGSGWQMRRAVRVVAGPLNRKV